MDLRLLCFFLWFIAEAHNSIAPVPFRVFQTYFSHIRKHTRQLSLASFSFFLFAFS